MPYLLYEKSRSKHSTRGYLANVNEMGGFTWTTKRAEATTWDDKDQALAARERVAEKIRRDCGAGCGAVLHIQPTTGGSCWIVGPLTV